MKFEKFKKNKLKKIKTKEILGGIKGFSTGVTSLCSWDCPGGEYLAIACDGKCNAKEDCVWCDAGPEAAEAKECCIVM